MMSSVNEVTLAEVWPIMEEQLKAGKMVRFGPKGTSMLPLIRQNRDAVMLKTAPQKLKKYDIPLYRRKDGQFVLHRIVAVKKDTYVMCGDNQWQREYSIKRDSILAVADGIWRENKYLSVNSFSYKIYSRKQVLKKRILAYKHTLKKIIKAILNKR